MPAAVAEAASAQPSRSGAGAAYQVVQVAALLVVVVLALMTVRLPWAGDLGIHAATLERLRHDLANPGDPLVDADTNSPYYSPWMVTLALIARATGAGTFSMLHGAAAVDLLLLVTGVRRFVRTFTARRSAVPLAVLTLTLLYGTELFTWSGFPGLTSLALCLAYPSTFALGAAFHLWALLRTALARDWPWAAYAALGVLLAVILLSHQFTGMVTVLGLVAILAGARPWPARVVWFKVGAAVLLALAIVLAWPYYSFFALLDVGGLDAVHKPLYGHLVPRFGLLALGVAALAARFWRDRRDPLVVLFVLGMLVYALGGVTGHWSWGRVLPAVFVSAQVALAVEIAGEGGRLVRRVLAPLTAAGLLVGCWGQAGSLGYVLRPAAIPRAVRAAPRQAAWSDYSWIKPYVRYGDVILTDDYFPLHQAPAYGTYTVASGYPDFFLPDGARLAQDTKRYFARMTSRTERLALLREYHVHWVIQYPTGGGLSPQDPAVQQVATSPAGEILLRVSAY
ncbi:hypothetical protein ACWFRJ_04380 [Streptomyces sp. NPDC055239]